MQLNKEYKIAVVCKILVIVTELLTTVFINRGLGVLAKGEYSYIIKIVEILYIICSVGVGQTYSTYKRNYSENYIGNFTFLALIQGVLVVLFGGIIVFLFDIKHGLAIVILTSVAVVKVIVTMIAVTERSITRNIIQVIINVIYVLGLSILYITHNSSLFTVITCYVLSDIIRILVLMVIYKMKPSATNLTFGRIYSIYKVGFITMCVMLLITLNYSVDTIMLRKMSTAYYVGIYSVGASFSNIFLMVPDAFKDVLFGDSAKKDFTAKIAYSAIKVSIVISIVALLGFYFLGGIAIQILYGSEFVSAYTVTLVLFIGCFPLIFFKILQPVYISHGKQGKILLFLLMSAIINIVANFLLIPQYNEIGAAVASVASYSVCGLLFLLDYRRTNAD